MPNQTAFLPLAALMFTTGLGIPVMAALNGGLGQQLGSPVLATFAMFLIALVLTGMVMAVSGAPDLSRIGFARPWLYAGAAFVVFYALSITFAAPRIGVGNAVFFVLLGQLVAAAVIDHFGLLGSLRFALTSRRLLGIAVMAVGVYLAKRTA